jgi:hypothetical protein
MERKFKDTRISTSAADLHAGDLLGTRSGCFNLCEVFPGISKMWSLVLHRFPYDLCLECETPRACFGNRISVVYSRVILLTDKFRLPAKRGIITFLEHLTVIGMVKKFPASTEHEGFINIIIKSHHSILSRVS